jgi:hypothetical protein
MLRLIWGTEILVGLTCALTDYHGPYVMFISLVGVFPCLLLNQFPFAVLDHLNQLVGGEISEVRPPMELTVGGHPAALRLTSRRRRSSRELLHAGLPVSGLLPILALPILLRLRWRP